MCKHAEIPGATVKPVLALDRLYMRVFRARKYAHPVTY